MARQGRGAGKSKQANSDSAKRTRSKKKPPPTLRPLKIVGQVVGEYVDEDGDPVGHEVIGNIEVFAKQFPKLAKEMKDRIWPQLMAEREQQAQAAKEMQENGPSG
jgi:hypothetical protein